MSDSEILLKAAINRIAARISKKVINSAEELAEITENLPEKIKDEWKIFKDEVLKESERLEQNAKNTNINEDKDTKKNLTNDDLIQIKIDELRSKVIEINKNIEEAN